MDLFRSVHPIGSVKLSFITSRYLNQHTVMVNFLVVNSLSVNNVIIGRPT